jgi:hypothetical protein
MRQLLGVQYGRERLPVPEWSKAFELEDFSTLLTNFLGVGADFRTLYYYRQVPTASGSGDSTNNAFWQMEGNLYLNFKLAKKVNIYLAKGLYYGFEIFGMLNILPANGYIKVGKFIPQYGLRLDDHTAFVRTETGFSPERGRPERTGFELGFGPGAFSVTGGAYNAEDGFGLSGSNKAFLGRAEAVAGVSEDFHLGLGANVYTTKSSAGERRTMYGGFGHVSYTDLTLLGEVDLLKSTAAGSTTNGLVGYLEAGYVIFAGFDLKFTYDFYDEDLDVKSGSTARYGFGFEFFPIAGVEVRPMYRILKENPSDVPSNEFLFLMHFYL